MKISRLRWVWFFLVVTPFLIAAALMQALTEGSMEAIVLIVSILVGLLGPKPLQRIIDKLRLNGTNAVLFIYFAAFVVGSAGLAVSQQLFDLPFTWDNVVAITGVLFAAATFAYHRLKDKNEI